MEEILSFILRALGQGSTKKKSDMAVDSQKIFLGIILGYSLPDVLVRFLSQHPPFKKIR